MGVAPRPLGGPTPATYPQVEARLAPRVMLNVPGSHIVQLSTMAGATAVLYCPTGHWVPVVTSDPAGQ